MTTVRRIIAITAEMAIITTWLFSPEIEKAVKLKRKK
jgi:hypothetical protein